MNSLFILLLIGLVISTTSAIYSVIMAIKVWNHVREMRK